MKFGRIEKPKFSVVGRPRLNPEPAEPENAEELDLSQEDEQSELEAEQQDKAPKEPDSAQAQKQTLDDTDLALLIDMLRKDEDIAIFEKAQMGALKGRILQILAKRLENSQSKNK